MAGKRTSSSGGRSGRARQSTRRRKQPQPRHGERSVRTGPPSDRNEPSELEAAEDITPPEERPWAGGETGEDEDLPEEGSVEHSGTGPRRSPGGVTRSGANRR